MKKLVLLFLLVILLALAGPVFSADTMIFDSTNNYLGGCQLTDKSEWELKQDLNVSKFQLWYNWDQGETNLPVTVFFQGEEFAKFTATRAACDPYQKLWCNADYSINKLFPKGKYLTQISNKRQCLKPGGTGTVRLYESAGDVVKEAPTNSPQPTVISAPAKTVVSEPLVRCSCSSTIVTTAVITSLASSVLSFLLFKFIRR